MAGTFPGVEAARRRRFHLSGSNSGPNPSIRRPSYCLYVSSHQKSHIFSGSSCSSMERSSWRISAPNDAALGHLARKAKERLDERLRAQNKSEIKFRRNNSDLSSEESTRHIVNGSRAATNTTRRELRTEVYGSRKSKRFSWTKLGWKPWDQQECAVCLDQFKVGENLVNLPCSHKFHSRCLIPWIESNGQCPCCRTTVFNTSTLP